MEDSGAVFLYRRNAAPSGYDWSSQEDQASWALEEVLTLPSGFWRDYSYVATDFVGEPPDAQYLANVRKWAIGQYGRNFGYSVDIVSDPSDESKDIVVVGAPRAKFDRTFTEAPVKTIKAAFIVISDNLDVLGKQDKYKELNEFITNRNRYFRNIANPAFEIDPTYIILSATKNLGIEIEDQITQQLSINYPEYKSGQINRIISLANLDANSLTIQNQIKEIFNEQFPLTASVVNSGLPAFMGVFVDNSNSLGRFAVEPAIDDFISYFKEYTFASGLLDANDNPISGLVVESTTVPDGEEWIYALDSLTQEVLANNTITNNLDLFTTSFNPESAPTSSGYNDIPTSGGRVYVFEKEYAKSGLFYNEDQYIWTMTQEIGLDRYLHDVKYLNERFGHAVAISKDKTKIAIGSPYDDNIGVRVYEKSSTYNLNHYYDNVGRWINQRVAENQDDISSIYYSLYNSYQDALESYVSSRDAGKAIYDTLDPSGRFDLKFYYDINISTSKNKYSEIFSYKNDYNMNGTWQYMPEVFASFPRVGYSVALNDNGNILAVGCPTDSMNQHDDSNVYHRNTKFCDEDKGVNGDLFIPGYDSPLDEDADLVTGQFNDGGDEGTFHSYVNAGAVQLFDSRRYYPHNKVIEYGIFGNKQKSIANEEGIELYFDLISGVYNSDISFERTSFTDPEIPQEAGLVFITTPEVDSLSDEVLENIQNWLDLGDRNLVIVGNDPTWENDGAYAQSNKIANKILDRLGSRVRLYPARNTYHALVTSSGVNTIAATRPVASYDPYAIATAMQASGVADIRFYDPSIATYSHDCDENFALTNITCQPDIKHEGDLRAEWFDLCATQNGRCVRTPRNIQAAYGIIPGLTDPTCNAGQGCYSMPDCTWSPNTTNLYKAPTPVLAAAEPPSQEVFKTIPATPDSTGVRRIEFLVNDPTKRYLDNTETFKNDPTFYIYSSGNSSSYSGVYEDFETNYENTADAGSEWFKPESLTKDYILQSSSTDFIRGFNRDIISVELPAWCAETKVENGNRESYVTLIASVAQESYETINAGSDQMLNFYNNLLSKRISLRNEEEEGQSVKQVYIAQLGGWTDRTSFTDGYEDSILLDEFNTKFFGLGGRPHAHVDENVIASSADDLIDYDICWIANTDQIPSDDDVAILREWLEKGNKRLVITYGCTPDGNPLQPSIIHANATYELCEKLGIDIKPSYLVHKKKFATWKEDTRVIELVSSRGGDSYNNPWNNLHPLYSDNLPNFDNIFGDGANQNQLQQQDNKVFIPIDTSVSNYVAYFGYLLQRSTYYPLNVVDTTSGEENKHYINSGWTKLTVDIPEIENSGYNIEIKFATEDPAERAGINYYVLTENLAQRIYKPDGSYVYSTATLNLNTLQDSPVSNLIAGITGTRTAISSSEVRGDSSTIKIGPLWATSSSAAIYIAANDVTLKDEPFNSARITSIIGYRVPSIIGKRTEYTTEEFIIPGTPERRIKISPPTREISTSSEIYCPSQEDECLDRFITPYNQRRPATEGCIGIPVAITGRDSFLTDITGPHSTVDGPVIVSQEYYLENNFEAGVNRSRITVISDASLIQGKLAYDEDNNKKSANVAFVNSLYPYTDFPTDVIYNTRYKITSPERGSPYKWYSATGNSGLIERFIRNPGYVTPLPASAFRGNESDLDPLYVVRPKEFCQCFDSPVPCDKDLKIALYNSGLEASLNPFPQFSTTIDGTIYRDNNQLFKDTGYDYLDFEVYNEGYPGDLFGYSVKLTNDRLFVGAPFAAFDQQSILDWVSISGTPSGEIPSGVELSSYGGAGAVYMFEKTLDGGKYIKNKNSEFVRESGTLDWEYVKKFRPDSINVGQDLTSNADSLDPTVLDSNTYSDDELTNLSKETDKFGFSIAIESGVLVIGAPGHDFGNFIDDGQSSGLFMSKAFDNSFPTPSRSVYNLGSSGIRDLYPESGVRVGTSGIKFGATVLNNGAAFVFTEDYNYATEQAEWSFLEKIAPEGVNASRQFKTLGSFPEVPFSGSENSRFGSSVAVYRSTRSDSDYCILVGSKDHPFDSGNDLEERKENKGAAYTYDLILRKQPPALADSGAFINAKLFAESGTPKLHEEIFLNITNSGLNHEYYENTGIIFSNSDGEIFLEVSGQDKSYYQYINHRPYIAAVYGSMLAGTKISNGFRLFVEGRPNETSGNMNMSLLGSGMADVYNDVGLVTFGATGFASGVPSGLYLFNKAENPLSINDFSNLYTSGANFVAFSGTPSGLGFFVSGLLPVDNSGELNVFVSG